MGIVLILIVAGVNILSTVLEWGGIILFAIGSYYGRGKNQSDLNEEANEEVWLYDTCRRWLGTVRNRSVPVRQRRPVPQSLGGDAGMEGRETGFLNSIHFFKNW